MNILNHIRPGQFALTALAAATLGLAACSAGPVKPDGADRVRAELTALQTNPQLATRAPVALQDAEAAVRAAEVPTEDSAAGSQRVYVADRKVAIARAQAERRLAEDQVKTLSEQRGEIRLDARTAEANTAKAEASVAKSEAEQALSIAQMQQRAAGVARAEAEAAKAQTEDLKRQMEDLQAKQTDRGLVMTLGDVLFATGKAELKAGSQERLGKLVAFLAKYPDRTVIIEGHTDSVGSDESNQSLSQRRADVVKAYLAAQGVGSNRVQTAGKGESLPVADNGDAAGRQQNRRVEIIISNVVASR
ncbi:MAG: OmpA family protein [Stagnimonas sp.]|nr:OmpA family protein [Stagnimonas sp.]